MMKGETMYSTQKQGRVAIDRRSLLGASAALAVGGMLGLAGCSSSPKTDEGSVPDEGSASSGEVAWDEEADVVVVGSGTGAFSALAAADAGAGSVVVLEKSEAWGGTSAVSGCTLYIPMLTVGMEEGSDDSVQAATAYLNKVAGNRGNKAGIDNYVKYANEFATWLGDLMGWQWTAQGMFRDYYEPYEGYRFFGRNASIDSEEKVPMWSELQNKCKELGVDIRLSAPAKELVTDASGAVVGVVAEIGGKPVRIKANTCVVMATGGYDHNPQMILENQAVPVYVSNAAMTNTGDGQIMGAKVGAAWGNMDTNWGLPCFYGGSPEYTGELVYDFLTNDWGYYRGSAGAIVVNRQGRRFGDESSAYGVFNRAFGQYDTDILDYTNIPAFFICDDEYVSTMTLPGQAAVGDPLPDYFVQADTLQELAGKLGIDPEGLVDEVASFNEGAAVGEDPTFHRGEKECNVVISAWRTAGRDLPNPVLAPLATPPFYGAVYVPGTCGTNGGLVTDENARVLTAAHEPIPGLLAVGNCSAGIFGGQYPGAGATLGAGGIMGYIGVRNALGTL